MALHDLLQKGRRFNVYIVLRTLVCLYEATYITPVPKAINPVLIANFLCAHVCVDPNPIEVLYRTFSHTNYLVCVLLHALLFVTCLGLCGTSSAGRYTL